jgi:hypothetical protein
VSVVEGPGVKVGEGTVLHPIFGAETGFISNVFYEDTNPKPAGLLRLLAQMGSGSLPLSRLTSPGMLQTDPTGSGDEQTSVQNAGDFQYRADLRLSYDLLLSTNQRTTEAGGLGAGGTFRGLVNPLRTWSFGFAEEFRRLIRTANFETDADTNRIINDVKLRLFFQPQGRTLSGFLRYDNTIDFFERERQRFSNRIQHTFGTRVLWRMFPMTRIYVDGSIGVYGPLGSDSQKVSSYPLVAVAGVQTLLTLNTTVSAQAGYTNGFYSAGPSFSAPVIGAEVGYRYSPLGRVTAMYQYAHQDSVNANFFRDHILRLWVQQMYVPFAFTVQPELHLRRYEGIALVAGPPSRSDVILMAVGVHYNFRNWIAGTLGYNLGIVQTDYRYMTDGLVDDPSYIRHELIAGVRVAM